VTTGSSIALIAQREVRQRLRSRAFLVFTVLIAVVIVGIGVLHRVLSDSGPSARTVAVVGTAPPQLPDAVTAAGQALDLRIRLVGEPDEATARAALDGGQVDAVIVASSDGSLLFRSSIDTDLQRAVDAAWQSASVAQTASALGLSAEQTASLVSPPELRAVTIEPKDDDGPGMLVGFVTAVLLLVSVTTFGGYVLSGVVEEKTSAIIELLLSHVRAYQLLAGKVLGIGAVALVQMAVAVAAGAVALGISGASIPVEIWVAVPTTLLWFVAGFVLYSTLFALAGSFVSRQEDAQAAAAPISLTFMAAYFIVFTVGTDPSSPTATVLSLLPPFAPLLMPLRIATASATWWEIVVSAVLLIGAIVLVLRAAGAIYARTLLHRGSRITWREALRLRTG
jgi:ABC-2 type transport system permease protein